MKTRKAQALVACNKLGKIWKSKLCRELKVRVFLATVESVFLYGSETWTLTKRTEKQIDGAYTRMLRTALNVYWRDHITNEDLYGHLPNVSREVRERRMRVATKRRRHRSLCCGSHNTDKLKGRPRTTYIRTWLGHRVRHYWRTQSGNARPKWLEMENPCCPSEYSTPPCNESLKRTL